MQNITHTQTHTQTRPTEKQGLTPALMRGHLNDVFMAGHSLPAAVRRPYTQYVAAGASQVSLTRAGGAPFQDMHMTNHDNKSTCNKRRSPPASATALLPKHNKAANQQVASGSAACCFSKQYGGPFAWSAHAAADMHASRESNACRCTCTNAVLQPLTVAGLPLQPGTHLPLWLLAAVQHTDRVSEARVPPPRASKLNSC